MKIKILILIVFYCSLQDKLYAQEQNKGLSIGLNFGKTEYNGDYGNGIWKLGQPFFNPQIGLSLSAYISPSLDIGVQYSYGEYGYWEDEVNYFIGTKLSGSVFLHYKFNNGYILPETSKFSPFISFGIWPGFATYDLVTTDKSTELGTDPTIVTDGVDMIIPVGAGVKYNFNNQFSIQYQYLYNFTNSDVHDQNRSGGVVNRVFGYSVQDGSSSHEAFKPGNDAFGEHVFSIIVNINNIHFQTAKSSKRGRGLIRLPSRNRR